MMETFKLKSVPTGFVSYVSHQKTKPFTYLSNISIPNRKVLKNFIKYVVSLKEKGTITEEQFTDLVTLACTNYVENEVEARISSRIAFKADQLFEKMF